MKAVSFYKMSGSGNDFIIIDNRKTIIDDADLLSFIKGVCDRRQSLGADGVILVEESDAADFKWRFYNKDGSEAGMCGNGARCVARFAYETKIAGDQMTFETKAGLISAQVTGKQVKIKTTDPLTIRHHIKVVADGCEFSVSAVDTGAPHVVVKTEDSDKIDVVTLGRAIRYHDAFAPLGVNVNFICQDRNGGLYNRTYERGVEDETLACGTGCIACAVIMADLHGILSPVSIRTKGGECLTIYFKQTQGRFHDVYLEGLTRIICRGDLFEEAWK